MKKFTIAFVFLTLIIDCAAQNATTFPQQLKYNPDIKATGTTEAKLKSIDSLLLRLVDQQKVSSVVAFVAKSGNVVYNKAFGYKDIENRVPAKVDDYYIKFSQTKAVVTVAFMTLVEKGLVSIDDPVSKFFPGIPDRVVTVVNEDGTYQTRPVARPMTFVHLMAHSSGLNAGLVADIRKAEMKKRNDSAGSRAATGPGQRTGGAGTERYLKDNMEALAVCMVQNISLIPKTT